MFRIFSEIAGARVGREFVLKTLHAGRRLTGRAVGDVNIIIVGDRKMATLHREYSGVKGTTDVLTFDLTEETSLEGDIYICLDQARRQATAYQVTLREEIARLAVHGLLHLAGYDDHSERGRAEMRRLEDECLRRARRMR